MDNFVIKYIIVLLTFTVIDLLWLGIFAKNLYKKYLGHLMRDRVYWPAAIIFYLLYIGGILYFAVNPAIAENSMIKAMVSGSLFGFLAYATYDLTNLATLKDWPRKITIIDLVWGTILTGGTAITSFGIIQWLN